MRFKSSRFGCGLHSSVGVNSECDSLADGIVDGTTPRYSGKSRTTHTQNNTGDVSYPRSIAAQIRDVRSKECCVNCCAKRLAEAERISKGDWIAASVAVEVDPAGEPNGILRQEGPFRRAFGPSATGLIPSSSARRPAATSKFPLPLPHSCGLSHR
jgi:hypothetical protein